VTYSEKSLFVEDELAELLIEYAKVLAQCGESDTVEVPAIGADGNVVEAVFLLTPSTILMIESANGVVSPPGDPQLADRLRDRIRRLTTTNVAVPETDRPVDPDGDDLT